MRKVFVDCDDTLLLFDSEAERNPLGFWAGDPYRVNAPLAEALLSSCADCFTLIIWSGGGGKYAKEVSKAVFGEDHSEVDAWLVKDITTFHLVKPGDIVIDDQMLAVGCEQLRPHDIERLKEVLICSTAA